MFDEGKWVFDEGKILDVYMCILKIKDINEELWFMFVEEFMGCKFLIFFDRVCVIVGIV